MTKEELWRELDKLGIEYDKRWGVSKLEGLMGKTKQEEEQKEVVATRAVEDLKNMAKKTEELVDSIVHEIDGRIMTEGGLMEIPKEVLANLKPTQWHYFVSQETPYSVIVSKVSKAGREQVVREYTQEIHGEQFKELAKGFVYKKNS